MEILPINELGPVFSTRQTFLHSFHMKLSGKNIHYPLKEELIHTILSKD